MVHFALDLIISFCVDVEIGIYHQTFPLVLCFLFYSNMLTVSGKRRLLSFNFHQVQENMVFQVEILCFESYNCSSSF